MLSAVVEDEDDTSTKLADVMAMTGDLSSSMAKPVTPSTPVPGKRTLKNVKTMFFVGTEVSSLVPSVIIV